LTALQSQTLEAPAYVLRDEGATSALDLMTAPVAVGGLRYAVFIFMTVVASIASGLAVAVAPAF
jgi:hypothetical protein